MEAHIAQGLPHFAIGGLPDTACAQAPDRVRPAAASSGVPVPPHRVTVNLSPASIPKRGACFDLPIAVAVLAAAGLLGGDAARDVVHLGELALDGRVRGVRGILPAVLEAARRGVRHIVVPLENVAEAQLVDGVVVHGAGSLADVVRWYTAAAERGEPLPPAATREVRPAVQRSGPDLADVVGQPEARLALELAATGGHHLLMAGPPGVGKTMLAERLVTVLPPLSREEALETHAIRSLTGQIGEVADLDCTPPFVAPHHSSSVAADRRWRVGDRATWSDLTGAPRRPLPRRGAGVQDVGPADPATAAGGRRGRHRPCPAGRPLPRAVPARPRREPVPLRPGVG